MAQGLGANDSAIAGLERQRRAVHHLRRRNRNQWLLPKRGWWTDRHPGDLAAWAGGLHLGCAVYALLAAAHDRGGMASAAAGPGKLRLRAAHGRFLYTAGGPKVV